ncbi:MAG: ADP-ribosylglycohydrolase family protein [bacterium]
MNELRQRAYNAMLGLAVGDAMSWPAMFHRSYLLPFWTRRIRREMEAASETTNVIRPAMPFSLNRPAEAFAIGPTDDSEWAAFTAQQLLLQDGALAPEKLLAAWLELAQSSQNVRGSVSIQATLANLRQEKFPPQSGKDNPHYFDDSAVCRAVPIGVVWAGRPNKAAEMAALDAAVTNAEDGVWAAQAVSAAISVACAGGGISEIIAAVMCTLPDDAWIKRSVMEALQFCREDTTLFDIFPQLSDGLINREYSYGSVAPETLALALVIMKFSKGDFKSAVMAAASFAKTADSVPALVGALSGAMMAQEFISQDWRERFRRLQGICVPTLAGVDYIELTERLADLAVKNS